jgi:hypothetical protein
VMAIAVSSRRGEQKLSDSAHSTSIESGQE